MTTKSQATKNPASAFAALPRYARERAYQAVRAKYGSSEKIGVEMMMVAHIEYMELM
ncbi:MAG: hypothetical protein ACYDHX_07975 [Methanothrix sp.]